MALSGCAKDTGGGGGSASGQPCQTKPAPSGPAMTTSQERQQTPPDASDVRVGLAFDIGGRGDGSFNDASVAGLDRAKKDMNLGEVKELDSEANESASAKLTRLRQLAREGYNPVIAVGYSYADSVGTVAEEFPDTQFAIIDDDTVKQPNVTPLVFSEEKGSFLAGVIAAHKSQTCHIGFVGGVETPLIKKFEAGYVQGVKDTKPSVKVDVQYLSRGTDLSGFSSPDKGKEAASGMLDNGADVVYTAAGSSGNGAIEAVNGVKGAWAIGVDSDQYNIPGLSKYKNSILTSMVKNVDVGVYDFVKSVHDGKPLTGVNNYSLAKDGVSLATSGGFIDDIKSQLDAAKKKIVDGGIKVKTTP